MKACAACGIVFECTCDGREHEGVLRCSECWDAYCRANDICWCGEPVAAPGRNDIWGQMCTGCGSDDVRSKGE